MHSTRSNQSAKFRLLRVVASLVLALALGACSRADDVDELVKTQLAKQQVPGAAVVVVKGGKVIKAAAYGLADTKQAIPATTDTVFRIQSMTKQFTAAGIMLLVEDGKVRLDEPVNSYLEGCPPAWQKLTVRHLLTQTSGLRDFINEPVIDLGVEITDQKLLESIASQPLKFEPGAAWDYSNSNYHLLAMIIRQASGQWYGDFLAQRIFKPLGMTHTSVTRERGIVPGGATGYSIDHGRIKEGSIVAAVISSNGGAGISSTVLDLAKWDAALYAEQLLKRASLEQLWTPVKLSNGTTHDYGFGWELGDIAGHRRLWHGGNFTGFASHIDRFVDDQLTVIVLTNLANSAPSRISRAVAASYLPALAPPNYKPIPDPEPKLTAHLVDVLRRSSEGRSQAADFTPDVWSYLETQGEQVRIGMAPLGPIEKLTLVERTSTADARSYRYQARFKNTGFIFHFVLTKDDKISLMAPEEINQ